MEKIRAVIDSPDQLTGIGLAGALHMGGQVDVVGPRDAALAQVLLYATSQFTPAAASRIRQEAGRLGVPAVLVVDELNEGDLLTTVRCGVVAVLLRSTLSVERLTKYLTCAAGGGAVLPPEMLSEFVSQVRSLRADLIEQRGMNRLGLTERELDVLRLLADGHGTIEISKKLAYSERTIKNVLSSVLTRLGLRNRTHAVACAMRSGLL